MLELKKRRAHKKVRLALSAGVLVRPDRCEECGGEPGLGTDGRSKIHGHHYLGYDHPLDVQWLCALCHRAETPSGRARLTEAQAIEILALPRPAKRGKTGDFAPNSLRDLSRRYGVGKITIADLLAGRTWKHLPRGLDQADREPSEGGE